MHGASTQGAHGHGCDANRTHNCIITIPCKQFARCNWYGDRKLEHCIIVSTELHAKKNSHHRLNVWIWFRHALYTSALIERAGCVRTRLHSIPSQAKFARARTRCAHKSLPTYFRFEQLYLFRWWLAWWPFNMRWISANVAHPRAREADTLQLCGTIKLMFCALRVNFWPFAETNYNTLCKSVLEKKNSKLGQSDGSARDAQIDFIAHQTSESAPSSSVRGCNFIHCIASAEKVIIVGRQSRTWALLLFAVTQ